MIRVVVDTGIVVSAAFRDRVPEEIILFLVENPDFSWVISDAILNEYKDVLARKKFNLTPALLERWSDVFRENTVRVEPDLEIDFPRDQKDSIFIECAIAAAADYLITGDKDFEEARMLLGTTIISAAQFNRLVIKNWN